MEYTPQLFCSQSYPPTKIISELEKTNSTYEDSCLSEMLGTDKKPSWDLVTSLAKALCSGAM